MSFYLSQLIIVDNSGAKRVRCLHVFGKKNGLRRSNNIGQLLAVAVVSYVSNKRIQRKTLYKACLVSIKRNLRRRDGSFICFDRTAAVMLSSVQQTLGTRISTPIPRELKKIGLSQIVALAKGVC